MSKKSYVDKSFSFRECLVGMVGGWIETELQLIDCPKRLRVPVVITAALCNRKFVPTGPTFADKMDKIT